MKKISLSIAMIGFCISIFGQGLQKKSIKNDTEWLITDSVTITDGYKESVKVYVIMGCPKDKWDQFLKLNENTTDSSGLYLAISMLAIDAQYSLKNTASFVPMRKQIITWDEKQNGFSCWFKMMGRNGYGNLIETDKIVVYKPFK